MIRIGGPAGSTIASTLAHSRGAPSILLLEAGAVQSDPSLRVDGERWVTSQRNTGMNWGYKTTSQEHCENREIDYSRGRALGGTSTINFGVYTVGAKGDYDEWARVVGNDTFKWDNMQRRFKLLETFHYELPEGGEKYAAPNPSDHGNNGPIHVAYSQQWEKDFTSLLDVFDETGFPLNKDHNSGNPIGMSVLINTAHGGIRSTAADALVSAPNNLTIRTESTVLRLIIKGRRAVGVMCNGTKCMYHLST